MRRAICIPPREVANLAYSAGIRPLLRLQPEEGGIVRHSDEELDLAPSLPDTRPGSDRVRCGGRESNFLQQDGGRAPEAAAKPAANPNAKPLDRATLFKKWEMNRDGKLSPEEYTAGLAQKGDAPRRFKNFDTNGEGMLVDEEFVKAGKP